MGNEYGGERVLGGRRKALITDKTQIQIVVDAMETGLGLATQAL